jgi:hypothetical protein
MEKKLVAASLPFDYCALRLSRATGSLDTGPTTITGGLLVSTITALPFIISDRRVRDGKEELNIVIDATGNQ